MGELDEIKKNLKEEKLIIGSKETLKAMKTGKLSKIWMCKNASDAVKEDINKYAQMTDIEIENLDIPNDELGVILKKQFAVSVVSLIKGGK